MFPVCYINDEEHPMFPVPHINDNEHHRFLVFHINDEEHPMILVCHITHEEHHMCALITDMKMRKTTCSVCVISYLRMQSTAHEDQELHIFAVRLRFLRTRNEEHHLMYMKKALLPGAKNTLRPVQQKKIRPMKNRDGNCYVLAESRWEILIKTVGQPPEYCDEGIEKPLGNAQRLLYWKASGKFLKGIGKPLGNS